MPACLSMLRKVSSFKSSDGFPATVTLPGSLGCLYCRWLPLVLTSTQPALSSNRITSATFILPVRIVLRSRWPEPRRTSSSIAWR